MKSLKNTPETDHSFKFLVPFTVKEDTLSDDVDIMSIEGYASFYGTDQGKDEVLVEADLAGDAVVPSGIDISVYKDNPVILWQHDRDYPIGKATKVTKKKQGLYITADIYKSTMKEEDWERVRLGIVTKFSIGFRCIEGEWKEVNGKSIYFIKKSLLLENSIVTLPCNTKSGYQRIKGLSDDAIIAFDEDIQEKQEVQPTQQPAVTNKEIGDDKMKMKLRDLLAEDKVKELEALGLTEKLEEETDVDVKAFVEAKIKQELAIFKEALLAELKVEVETEVKEEVPATPSTETEVTTEEKEKEVEEGKEDEVDEAQLKALSEAVEKLKALI